MDSLRKETIFCTGSSYEGSYNEYGMMEGVGKYKYPDGTIYEGEFKNGVFQGKGTITLPSLFKLHGNFINGKCQIYETEFTDGLSYKEENWTYCQYPDRRYQGNIKSGIPALGELYITARGSCRKIPDGWYDTEDGFFDPNTGYIMSSDDHTIMVRNVSQQEKKWIMKHYRNTDTKPVGYQQDIIDENILAVQELFEDELSECVCFTDSSEETSSSMKKDSDTVIQGSRGTSTQNSTSNENEIIELANLLRGNTTNVYSEQVEEGEQQFSSDLTSSLSRAETVSSSISSIEEYLYEEENIEENGALMRPENIKSDNSFDIN